MARDFNGKEKRHVLIFLSLIGGFSIVFGFFYINYNINYPFTYWINNAKYSLEEERLKKIADLQGKDTDEDTLSDFDEQYIYKTSVYLADSDSDGVNDAEELAANTDPNCPEGKNCAETDTNTNSTASNSGTANLTVAQMRDFLISSGVSESSLSQFDDATIINLYNSIISDSTSNDYTSLLKTDDINYNVNTAITDLANLTPAQIREVLIEAGMDETELNKISDEDLKKVYQQTLEEQGLGVDTNTEIINSNINNNVNSNP